MPEEITTIEEEPSLETALPPPHASFPWLMLCVAIIFDLIEFFIPLLLPVFGLIMGIWQKMYAPKTDPFATFLVSKIVDILSLGILPSSTAVVIFAYAKKKITEKKATIEKLSKSKIGKYATNKFSEQSA